MLIMLLTWLKYGYLLGALVMIANRWINQFIESFC